MLISTRLGGVNGHEWAIWSSYFSGSERGEVEFIGRSTHFLDESGAVASVLNGESPSPEAYVKRFLHPGTETVALDGEDSRGEVAVEPGLAALRKRGLDCGRKLIFSAHAVSLKTMAMINLKNVSLVPERTRPRRKVNKRSRDKPRYRFHVLEVKKVGKARTGTGTGGQGRGVSLHSCRGHVRDCTERGLFGNPGLKGRYWIPDHERGSRDEGVVIKDYRVGPENDSKKLNEERGE
jgi:hypothetical protein